VTGWKSSSEQTTLKVAWEHEKHRFDGNFHGIARYRLLEDQCVYFSWTRDRNKVVPRVFSFLVLDGKGFFYIL